MPITKLQFTRPGINKQDTPYAAKGGWVDCDNVRFRYGVPEKIGGWVSASSFNMIGAATDIHNFTTLDGTSLSAIGTNNKLYVLYNNYFYDITPISTTLSAAFTFTTGSSNVNVLSTASGVSASDFVTFSGVSGVNVSSSTITNTTMASQFQVQSVVDVNNFTLNLDGLGVPGTVISSGTATSAVFQITAGVAQATFGNGWSASTWGNSTWNTPRTTSVKQQNPRIWKLDNFGQDLIATIIGGSTYYLNTANFLSSPSGTVATLISQAPSRSNYMLVDPTNRSVVFFGTQTTPNSTSTFDPMAVLFSSQESTTDYIPTAVNTAGFQRLASGNQIVTAVNTRGNILVLTNISAHSMQYIGPPYTFGFTQIGENCGAIGYHSAIEAQNVVYWMSPNAFYMFDGTVKQIPCSVQDYVFNNLNFGQTDIIFCGSNTKFAEVSWFYATNGNNYVTNVVTYNYRDNVWTVGTLARTTWADKDIFDYPLATAYNPNSTTNTSPTVYGLQNGISTLYYQENGLNADGQAMTAYIESADVDIIDGDDFMFVKRYIPDFLNLQGDLNMQILIRNYPQTTLTVASNVNINSTTIKVDMRARARQIAVKMQSNSTNNSWRFGTLRIDSQADGKR